MFFAYIDPGLGALIWQSIVAAFVGLLFYLKKTRCWIVTLFWKIFGRSDANAAVKNTFPAKTPSAKDETKIEVQ